jgi:AcrR family transcriptional regulator
LKRKIAPKSVPQARVEQPPAASGQKSSGEQRLLRTALKLFAEKGFDSVSVRDIAAACEVSIGLISHHFGSKDGLREAVDRYFIQQFEEALSTSAPIGRGDREQYASWIDDWIARHQADWPVTVGYFRRAVLEESEWGASLVRRFYEFVQATIARMDVEGGVRPDVDRLWLPFLIMYLELGTMLLDPHIKRILGKSGYDPTLWQRRHRAYMDLIYRGVAPAGMRDKSS